MSRLHRNPPIQNISNLSRDTSTPRSHHPGDVNFQVNTPQLFATLAVQRSRRGRAAAQQETEGRALQHVALPCPVNYRRNTGTGGSRERSSSRCSLLVPLMSIMSPRPGRSLLIYNRVTGLAARAATVRGQFGTDGWLRGEACIEKLQITLRVRSAGKSSSINV